MSERERTGIDAFLGKGTTLTGTLVLAGPGRIEGHVDGEITAQDTLTIGEGATVNASVTGTTIIVEGRVTGDVTARQRIELRASGCIHGNVTTPSLVVHEGATLEGHCAMSGQPADRLGDATVIESLDRTRATATHLASTLSR